MENKNKVILQIIVIAAISIALLWLSRMLGILDNVATLTLGILLGFVLIPALLRKIGLEV